MREIVIRENDANQRVDKFLSKHFKIMPKNLMYKYIRNKKIKVNKKRCEVSQILKIGDVLQCYIAESFFLQEIDLSFLKAEPKLDIVYEDEHLLIIDKPVGLKVHEDEHEKHDTLINRILHYLYLKKEYDPNQEHSFRPALCHRLDQNTKGLIMAAKNAHALRSMNLYIKEKRVIKLYYAIVEGHLHKKKDLLVLYHQKKEHNKVDITDQKKDNYKEVSLEYHVKKENKYATLVEINLLSGKSHQIRAMFSYIGHPLVGDRKYGAKLVSSFKYQALYAYQLQFSIPESDQIFKYLNKLSCYADISILENEFHKL